MSGRVVPGMPARARRAATESRRDRDWLLWLARFRFVTAADLAARFGVSEQQARARVRRLQAAGLLGCTRAHVGQPFAIYMTPHGAAVLGLPGRFRVPRAGVQRKHELAIVRFVAALERRAPGLAVLTERECRRREAETSERFSVDVLGPGRRARRWPDAVVQLPRRRAAVEFEFTTKSKERLRQIVGA